MGPKSPPKPPPGPESIYFIFRFEIQGLNKQTDSDTLNVLDGTMQGLFGSKQNTVDNTYQFYIEKTYSFHAF